ncbi:MAG: CaiB/BaiF CoA-transferase family protein [Dehalococcoidia bacterium]|nr:CaiB/BaiF CoA-transferase family protein [Dehalococcoidia bacterium]
MLALDGIRILDMARMGPGPHCAQILADLGADVIRVEEPGEGRGRRAGRVMRFPGDAAIGRNSRSITLNLKTEEGRSIFHKLAATADVIMEGFRPGVVKRLGVDYDTIRALKPDIVYISLTGYGQDGPYAAYVGHDINYQGLTGILSMTGSASGPPAIPGNTIADNAGGGMNAAIGILVALLAKERTGRGQYIDMAMVDGLMTMMFLTIDEYFTSGVVPHRGETLLTGRYPWYNIYETKEGKYISVGAIEPWFYENLCRLLGREDLIPHQYAEGEKRGEVFAAFREIFRTKTRDEWMAELMPAETCVGPVYSMDEVANDPHLRHRELIVDVEQPGKEPRRQVGVMVKLSETPGGIRSPGRELGQDTAEILRELGYDGDSIDALRRAEAII